MEDHKDDRTGKDGHEEDVGEKVEAAGVKRRVAVPLALYKASKLGDLAAVKEELTAHGVDVNEEI